VTVTHAESERSVIKSYRFPHNFFLHPQSQKKC